MPQPLQVEPRHLLAVGVGQRVEAAQLLQVLPIAGAPAVRRHDAVEGPVGAAAQGEADHDVAAAVALQEAAACGESAAVTGRAAPGPAGRAPGHLPSCTMAAAGPFVLRGLMTYDGPEADGREGCPARETGGTGGEGLPLVPGARGKVRSFLLRYLYMNVNITNVPNLLVWVWFF